MDDEPNVCELISEIVKGGGYEAHTAGGGHEGLEKASSVKPDLILLDVMMPVLNGWQMLERLRNNSDTEHIPVVMLTAKSETDALFRSRQLKVLDYFIKPVEGDELIRFIRRYLDLTQDPDQRTR